VRTGGLEQVRDQPGRDRLPAAVLLVLPGIGIERRHHGDPLGVRALERVHHDELFHQPGVHRRGVTLQHKRVTPTDRLLEPDENLAVGEVVGVGGHRRHVKFPGHLSHEFRMRPATEQHQVAPVLGLVDHHDSPT
jgi:hypothetical protein